MLGPDQHATYVITGNLRTANGQIRCNLTLRNTQTDDTLWTQRFDGALAEGFDLQDRITDALIGAVEIEVSDGLQARRWRAEAGNADAYDLFRDGRAAYKDYARPANLRARKQFEQALTLAPGFLSAAVGLARTHIEDATFGWSNDRERSLTHARDALDGVLSINPDHSAAHAERSHLLMVSGEYFEGLLAAELAVALDPDDAEAHNCRAYLLNCIGRYRDALASVQRSLALNPSGPEFYLQPMLYARLALGQYEDAISIADRILERRTKWLTAHALKIAALEGAGRHDDAVLAVNTLHGIRARFGISDWRKILQNPTEAAIPRMAGFLKQAGMPD
jgi:tetratricopeptide (TPR) repeat protein